MSDHYQDHRPSRGVPNNESCGEPAKRYACLDHFWPRISDKYNHLVSDKRLPILYTPARHIFSDEKLQGRLSSGGGSGLLAYSYESLRPKPRRRWLLGSASFLLTFPLKKLKFSLSSARNRVFQELSAYLSLIQRFSAWPSLIWPGFSQYRSGKPFYRDLNRIAACLASSWKIPVHNVNRSLCGFGKP